MNTEHTTKTAHLILHKSPNRRTEFWSDDDKGPVLVISHKDFDTLVADLAEVWLRQPNYCVNTCSIEQETPIEL